MMMGFLKKRFYLGVLVLFAGIFFMSMPVSAMLHPSIIITDVTGKTYDLVSFPVGDTITFEGVIVPDPGDQVATWRWEVNDPSGIPLILPHTQVVSDNFTIPGLYTAQLIVTDTAGLQEASDIRDFFISDNTSNNNLYADFTYAVDVGPIPYNITFIDQSQVAEAGDVITDWYWILDDTLISHNSNPSEVVLPISSVYGDHQVALRIDTLKGGKAFIEKPVSVPPVPTKNSVTVVSLLSIPDVSTLTNVPVQITFNATAEVNNGLGSPEENEPKIAGWLWNFEGSGVQWFENNSNPMSVSHMYAKPGMFTPNVTCVLKDGTKSDPKSLGPFELGPLFKADFFWDTYPVDSAAGHLVQFTDSSQNVTSEIGSWTWNFGDGNKTTMFSPPSVTGSIWHRYKEPGTYTVSLTITGQQNNIDSITHPVVVNKGYEPNIGTYGLITPNFNTVGVREGVKPLTVMFQDLSTGAPTTWLWKFGDGTSSLEKNPVHQYTVPGNYDVSLIVSNGATTNNTQQKGYVTVTET